MFWFLNLESFKTRTVEFFTSKVFMTVQPHDILAPLIPLKHCLVFLLSMLIPKEVIACFLKENKTVVACKFMQEAYVFTAINKGWTNGLSVFSSIGYQIFLADGTRPRTEGCASVPLLNERKQISLIAKLKPYWLIVVHESYSVLYFLQTK